MNTNIIYNRLRVLGLTEEDGSLTIVGTDKTDLIQGIIDEISVCQTGEESQAHSFFLQMLDLSQGMTGTKVVTGSDREAVVSAHVSLLNKTWENDEHQLSAILDIYQRTEAGGTKTVTGANRAALKTKLISLL